MLAGTVLTVQKYHAQANALAVQLDLPLSIIYQHRFPDAESLITLPLPVASHVILYFGLEYPNTSLVELLLIAEGLRQQQVQRITLVAPYLGYMRQDKAFHVGEVVSQGIIGAFISNHVDDLITVDPHLHRISSLSDIMPAIQARHTSATGVIGEFIRDNNDNSLLVGPDSESEQWVASIAENAGCDYVIGDKQRHSDTSVSITFPEFEYKNRNAILIDDIASSGQTLITAAKQLYQQGCSDVNAVVTHALFMEDGLKTMRHAGIGNVWSCDSIPHPTNKISLATTLAGAIKALG